MAAAAGATGVRSWLAAYHLTWLTPRRMRTVTIGLMVARLLASLVTLSGSTPNTHRAMARPGAAR